METHLDHMLNSKEAKSMNALSTEPWRCQVVDAGNYNQVKSLTTVSSPCANYVVYLPEKESLIYSISACTTEDGS